MGKFTEEELRDCALPPHLKGMKQTDRIWFFKNRFRGDDSYGPRCKDINPAKYLETPPKLVKGFSVTRWMMPKDESILHIKKFEGKQKSPCVTVK